MLFLEKVLIVYYSTKEKNNNKITNEDKVVLELEKLFRVDGFLVNIISLDEKMSLSEQFKKEKELVISQEIPKLSTFDYVIIGSPTVGSLTSAPLVNAFIRSIPKRDNGPQPKFALFVTGIIPGFGMKKMQSLLSMKGIKPVESSIFVSMFEFESKKLAEVKEFYNKIKSK